MSNRVRPEAAKYVQDDQLEALQRGLEGMRRTHDLVGPCRSERAQRLGRAIWKRWGGYHRRSLVAAKMRCVKLMGERVMARDFDHQVASCAQFMQQSPTSTNLASELRESICMEKLGRAAMLIGYMLVVAGIAGH